MSKLIKGNIVKNVDDSRIVEYLKNKGFDEVDDSGKVVDYGRRDSYSPAEYKKLLVENEELKAQIAKLKEKAAKKE